MAMMTQVSRSRASPVGSPGQTGFSTLWGDTSGQEEGGRAAVLRAQRQAKPGRGGGGGNYRPGFAFPC